MNGIRNLQSLRGELLHVEGKIVCSDVSRRSRADWQLIMLIASYRVGVGCWGKEEKYEMLSITRQTFG